MKSKIYFIVILLLTGFFGFGQAPISDNIDHYTNFMPETPNATAFVKYGNTTLNISKGVPNISIPLYNIKVDEVVIPITLSYDASGIKVDELSSSVGLKWRINAGGGIYRSVNGLPDGNGWVSQNWTSLDSEWYNTHNINMYTTQDYLKSTPIDHVPDSFTYNIANYFGTFIFKRKDINTILKDQKDNLSISAIKTGQQIASFICTDYYGNTYEFGQSTGSREFSNNRVITGMPSNGSISTGIRNYLTSWLVDEIITKNGKAISFDYIDYDLDYTFLQISGRETRYNRASSNSHDGCGNLAGDSPIASSQDVSHVYSQEFTSIINRPKNKLISKIETNKEIINFIYSDIYSDISSNAIWKKRLETIKITSRLNGSIVKTINFEYDYYTGSERLRLRRIFEEKNQIENNVYKFNYEGDNLPNFNSFSKDFYGFYNGKVNTSLIPLTPTTYANSSFNLREELADRKPVFTSLVTGNLNEIVYPTGGKTKFEYELNESENELVYGNIKYEKDEFALDINEDGINFVNGFRRYKRFFTIPEHTWLVSSTLGTANIKIVKSTNSNTFDPNSIDGSRFAIYEREGSQKGNLVYGPKIVDNNSGYFYLPSGDYFFELLVDENDYLSTPNLNVKINCNWIYDMYDAANNPIKEKIYAGGLRLKSQKDIDEHGNIFNNKRYEYSDLNCSTLNNFDFYSTHKGNGEFILSSDPISHPLLILPDYFYGTVIQKNLSSENNYNIFNAPKIESLFENKNSSVGYKSQLKAQFIYNKENDILSKTFYIYDDIQNTYSYNVLGKLNYCYHDGFYIKTGYNLPQNMTYETHINKLDKKIKTQYFYKNSATPKNVTSIETYEYNTNNLISEKDIHFEFSEIQNLTEFDENNYILDLDLKTIRDKYFYLTNMNYKGLLRRTTTFEVDNYIEKLLNTKLIIYDSSFLQERIQSSKGLNPLEDRIIYHKYDTLGNPLELSKADGTHICYIWGYYKTQPIAKIVGATYTEIENILGTDFSIDEYFTTTQESSLRNGLPNAQITTMDHYPLIGLKTVTDPKGDIQKYFYDNFNRLQYVKDKDDNILSENEYHYKQEN